MEFLYEITETISEGFRAFIGGFARLFLISFIIWMVSLVILLFRELFTPGELEFKAYFLKVWKMFRLSFESVAYGALVIAPILIYRTEEEYLLYSMVWVASIICSCVFIYLRKQAKRSKPKSDDSGLRFQRHK